MLIEMKRCLIVMDNATMHVLDVIDFAVLN